MVLLGADRHHPSLRWVVADRSRREPVEARVAVLPVQRGQGSAAAIAINADLVQDDIERAMRASAVST
jgi:hypothetical protein